MRVFWTPIDPAKRCIRPEGLSRAFRGFMVLIYCEKILVKKFTIHRLPSLSGMNCKVHPVKSLERPHLHEIFELLDPDLPLDGLVFG